MTERMTFDERAAAGGRARAEALTPEERKEIAAAGARARHSPAARARSIVKSWPTMSRADRAEVREILAPLMTTRGSRGQG